MEQLVDGDPLGTRTESGCMAVAFLTYTFVIMTYFGPVCVSLFTFLKFKAVSQGNASFAVGGVVVYTICVLFPMALGLILAGAAFATQEDGDPVLGSYRGLYCYIRRWDSNTTGLVTILFFCLTTI